MTESAEDRSKRKFIGYLSQYTWSYQISVFYQDYLKAQNAIEDSKLLRKAILREFPNQAFLWRIVLKLDKLDFVTNRPSNAKFVMPIHIFYTNKNIKNEQFDKFANIILVNQEMYTYKRHISDDKIASTIGSIRKQRPHDLHKYFNYSGKINRFSSPLNKKFVTIKN